MGLINANLSILRKYGFEVKINTHRSEVVIQTHVNIFGHLVDLKKDILPYLTTPNKGKVEEFIHRILRSKSCRNAVKFGDCLTLN
jgi:DNA mismatch repair ATPase MutL